MFLRISALAMMLASPAMAQMYYEPFEPNAERTRVTGGYERYQTHVLKLSKHRYAVLFQPGYVDFDTAVRAVAPLCAAQGRVAQGDSRVAPVDVLLESGAPAVQQGIRVTCVKSEK
ncbi:hypothetical protein [Gemmobacter sp. 24YEA27]|uniref:hypothetical protein n=1 Tax=Gemmobacter sp. 24YEA27 TaxID=3040672 RepID=UPI0024B3AC0A|nr:hypothetical protein [Gemmobacter sp. 24YEA27]